jgi:hypothetical protein
VLHALAAAQADFLMSHRLRASRGRSNICESAAASAFSIANSKRRSSNARPGRW